jgi:hypothetical protein
MIHVMFIRDYHSYFAGREMSTTQLKQLRYQQHCVMVTKHQNLMCVNMHTMVPLGAKLQSFVWIWIPLAVTVLTGSGYQANLPNIFITVTKHSLRRVHARSMHVADICMHAARNAHATSCPGTCDGPCTCNVARI